MQRFSGGKIVTVIAWVTKVNDDTVLDPGEKVLMPIYYADATAKPQSYGTIELGARIL